VPSLYRGIVLGALGEFDAAMDALEEAHRERHGQIIYLRVDPVFDVLRDHPRFQTLQDTIGLS
jgi:hypothetical protein